MRRGFLSLSLLTACLFPLTSIAGETNQYSIFNPNSWVDGRIEIHGLTVDVPSGNIIKLQISDVGLYDKIKETTDKYFFATPFGVFDDEAHTIAIRIFGVNTDMPRYSAEIIATRPTAQDAIKSKILNTNVSGICYMHDFFGRPTCSIFYDNTLDLTLFLIKEGYTYYDLSLGPAPERLLHEQYQKEDAH